MTKAIWNGAVLAESDNTIVIEGNHYFPPESVKHEHLKDSDLHTICPWKGQASYYSVVVEGKVNEDAAWYYPEPKKESVERIGQDFANFIAFWHGVEVQ